MADNTDQLIQQGDPRETLQEVVRAIKRNAVRVVFTTLVFVMIGLGLTMLWPNKYESSTQFVLRDWYLVSDSALLGELADIPLVKKLQALETELRSRKRIHAVMQELQWEEWLDTNGKESQRRDLLYKLSSNLTVEYGADITGAHAITLAFAWTSPRKAADFVNRLRDAWIQLTLESYKKSLEDTKERMELVLRDREQEFADALADLKNYNIENKVPSLLTMDTNNEQKAEQLSILSAATAELDVAVSEIERINAEMEEVDVEIEVPVPPASPEQAALLVKRNLAQVNLEKMVDLYKPTHARRVKAQEDLDKAEALLAESGFDPDAPTMKMDTNPKYYTLAQELKEAKKLETSAKARVDATHRLLTEIQGRLDKLPIVTQELEHLQAVKAIKATLAAKAEAEIQPIRERVKQLRSQTFGADSPVLSSVGGGGPFEILETGVEPESAVLPISAIIMAVALVMGLAVGAMGPVLSEMTRSSFGTVKEVSRSLGVPVLGAVDLILTAKDVRARLVQQWLTYATMALVLLSMATALFIYSNHPDVLPQSLLRALRDVRMALT
jgi:capsular polysaccharide biosynthesis protein